MIALDVHICDQRRSYLATFEGPNAEAMALAFIAARHEAKGPNGYGNHVITIDGEGERPFDFGPFPLLYDVLYPSCEHGMSAALCMGPDHYPSRQWEMEQGW